MKVHWGVLMTLLASACATVEPLSFPPPEEVPAHWSKKSEVTMDRSECPLLQGIYREPPEVAGPARTNEVALDRSWGSLYGYIPFHRAERIASTDFDSNAFKGKFQITQPDSESFSVSLTNANETELTEYRFRTEEKDFVCFDGMIEFAHFELSGMIEGRTVNFQTRVLMMADESGALLIHSMHGPYLENPVTADQAFKQEFLRYTRVE